MIISKQLVLICCFKFFLFKKLPVTSVNEQCTLSFFNLPSCSIYTLLNFFCCKPKHFQTLRRRQIYTPTDPKTITMKI